MLGQSKEINFTNKQLIALILPLLFEQLLSILVGVADSMMVAQVGDAAVSGVSLVDSISVLMTFVFSAMASGGVVVCGQYIGQRKNDNAKSAAHQLMFLLLVTSVGLTLLLYIFKNFIIGNLFGKIEADVMSATSTYYTIVMASIPAIAIYNGGAAIFRAIEKTKISLYVSLLMNAINVGGNALLIFGLKRGVDGVAIPTVVSRYVAAIVICILLTNKKHLLNLTGLRHFRVNKRVMKHIVSIGIPSGVENGMFQLGKLILFSYISTMGTASITANAIGGSVGNLQCFAGMATNLALTTVVSQCVGAGAFDKAKYYFKKIAVITYAIHIVINIALIVAIPAILRIYNVSPEATSLARTVLIIHGIPSMITWIPSFTTPAFLRSTGDASFTMIVSSLSMWIGRVGCGILLGSVFSMGVIGVWVAHSVIDWITRSIVFLARYKGEKWKSKAIRD